MVQPSRLSALAAGLAVLLLGGCASTGTPRQSFMDEIESMLASGLSYRYVVEQISYLNFTESDEPLEDILQDFDDKSWDREKQERDRNIEAFVRDIQNRRCEGVDDFLSSAEIYRRYNEPVIRGILHEEGICIEHSAALAAELYQETLDSEGRDVIAAARLGALYWRGEGVEKDPDRARQLFRLAALWQAPEIWMNELIKPGYKFQSSLEYRLWGLTQYEMDLGFMDPDTGPWDAPEPLLRNLLELLPLETAGSAKIVEIAQNLKDGVNGFPKDLPGAIDWIGVAARTGNAEAVYRQALWNMDPALCVGSQLLQTKEDCIREIGDVTLMMEMAAGRGHKGALRHMIGHYEGRTEIPWANWGLYQYCLMGRAQGVPCSTATMKKASDALGETERKIIATWIDEVGTTSIVNFLPGE